MKRCMKCVMPETWENITFDENGICNFCQENERQKKINWNERQGILRKTLGEYKNYAIFSKNKYNCIVGYSGGKDSVYTLWTIIKRYAMKPLVITFDHGFSLSPEAEYNLMEIPKKLDCDHLRFTLGDNLRNSLCRRGSEINGDFCWHCHNGVGTLPARISRQWDIPLQIWGEPAHEDTIEEQDREHFQRFFQKGITPEMMKSDNYEIGDLLPMLWPLGKFSLKAVYLGNFEPWNQREHVEIITKELGWKHHEVEGTYVNWDKVDCPYEPVRDWQKFIKRGFGRTTFQASKDIRDGLLSRKKALELIAEYDGKRPKILNQFLEETGMTEEEFMKYTKKHVAMPKKELGVSSVLDWK